jgi:hypothetical protein
MSELNDFYTTLNERIRARAAAHGEYTRTACVREMAERLVQAEEFADWTLCVHQGRGTKRKEHIVDGFSYDEIELDSSVSLVIADFHEDVEIPSLSVKQASDLFDKIINFVADAYAGKLHTELEQSTPACDLATWLYQHQSSINSIRLFLVTNAAFASRNREIPSKSIGATRAELHIWDVTRFCQAEGSGGREPIEIELTEFHRSGLPAIRAGIGDAGYEAFLCAVPGKVLADLYDKYGSRLLEGNVRSFLSTKANVNKGIRNTIINEPQRFFAYNNGITATATGVKVDEKGSHCFITYVKDLQIVNGGQTTASLFTALRKNESQLENLHVQVKLSIVTPEIAAEIIPLISRYANTQNKVSEADLFANHPFHRKIEEISRRLFAPPRQGAQHMTRWFYERARAQYLNEQSRLTPARKKEYLTQNPKDQLITKTDLAKYENSWAQLPHVVSMGAQKNFIKFAERTDEQWNRANADFNDRWFQHMVAKAILFHCVEDIVSAASWYQSGYRANIVTYAVAKVAAVTQEQGEGRVLDFDQIWKRQGISPALERQLGQISKAAFEILVSPPNEFQNVTEWAKKQDCWRSLKERAIPLSSELKAELKGLADERQERKDARGVQKMDDVFSAMQDVVQRNRAGYWARAKTWDAKRQVLTPEARKLLDLVVRKGIGFVPSDYQARLLVESAAQLEIEGFK